MWKYKKVREYHSECAGSNFDPQIRSPCFIILLKNWRPKEWYNWATELDFGPSIRKIHFSPKIIVFYTLEILGSKLLVVHCATWHEFRVDPKAKGIYQNQWKFTFILIKGWNIYFNIQVCLYYVIKRLTVMQCILELKAWAKKRGHTQKFPINTKSTIFVQSLWNL